ncbi:MAG: hypothetical protein HY047_10260 [Acidobacteria bacterium]|nr:hypothetical protein [Acidobacteriota bacterium]
MTPLRSRATFQTKFFFAALSAAVIALAVAVVLFSATLRSQTDARIEATLTAEARLAADLLARGVTLSTPQALDAEADQISELIGARVTFVAADGRVVGESSETLEGIAAMENHAQRPEIVEARASGAFLGPHRPARGSHRGRGAALSERRSDAAGARVRRG